MRLRLVLITVVAVIALTARAASASAAVLTGMWGPSLSASGPPGLAGTQLFPIYRRLHVGLYEDKLDWAAIAPRRPQNPTNPKDPAYAWPAEIDQAVAAAHANGIRVALMILRSPPWANGGRPVNWAPRRASDFADFAIAAARRYPSVRLWMIWGEPSRGVNFEPLAPAVPGARLNAAQKVAPRAYARMLDGTYGALKQLNRRNLVIGGMTYTTGDISTLQWIQNLRLPNGRPPRMDMYGHNPFSFRPPNRGSPPSPAGQVDFSDLGRLGAWVDRYLGRGRQLKLFLSEFTIPTAPDSEFDFYVDPQVQAQWIADACAIAEHWRRIYALGWIHLYDDPPTTASAGGLLDYLGHPKPGFAAFQHC